MKVMNFLLRNVAMKPQYFLATPCRAENPLVGDYLGQVILYPV